VVKYTLGFLGMARTWLDGSFILSQVSHDVQILWKTKLTRQCPSMESQQTWDNSLKMLQQWFQSSNTAHKIAKAIIWGLGKWRNPSEGTETRSNAPFIWDQEALGWDHLMDGWIHIAGAYTRKQSGIVFKANSLVTGGWPN